ncbi:outer membrane lipoprotein chaperone LolA [Limnohabitans sp.]|uniref:outer membrane lipoprotein chaperone LolA n=1 Tax=Limnohabitans sp. TaxID=1907725 RepID=UPI0039BD1D37|nr:outer membrane lipoprotein chaperone LolA [Comamonadaceae bacterium]
MMPMKSVWKSRRSALVLVLYSGWLWGVLSLALPVRADGVDLLTQFVKQARSGRADFTQVVTSPSRAGQAPRSKTSSGSFEFQRPGKFRFDYRKPFVQTLLADGQTLWLHDVDLNQVTARKQQQVLGSTPVALLTTSADLQSLKTDFQFSPEPTRDGLEWVRATPLAAEGQIRAVLVGLRATPMGAELAVLDVQDSLGQRSVLTFTGFQLNVALPATQFVFKSPAGADIIRP